MMPFNKKFGILAIVATIFIQTACLGSETSVPTVTESATNTPILPTETPTQTPSPVPATTPTVTPTPLGGRNSLLFEVSTNYFKYGKGTYAYDFNSHEVILLLSGYDFNSHEGYDPIGVSPDGKRAAVWAFDDDKADIFIVDLSNPENITPLIAGVSGFYADFSWFPETEWIGFTTKVNGVEQAFIIRSDGSDLTQVTNSGVGVEYLIPAFNNGVFWGEGKDGVIKDFKWTKLDGTETIIKERFVMSPDGKYMIKTLPSLDRPECLGYGTGQTLFEWKNLQTGETKEVCLTKPDGFDGLISKIQPLSIDKWLVKRGTYITNTGLDKSRYWIYSTDGTLLLDFEDLPHEHADISSNEEQPWDYYRIIGGDGGDLSCQRLSPDGNWLMIEHRISIEELRSTEYIESTYYLLNLSTFEIQQLPNLILADNGLEGFKIDRFWWIELP